MTTNPHVKLQVPAHKNNFTQNRAAQGVKKPTMIAIHHMAGKNTAIACGGTFQEPNRHGSSHYGIGYNGDIAQYVSEDDIAWTNSNWQANCESVTIEVSNNVVGNPWPISNVSLAALVELLADIAYRNNFIMPLSLKTITGHTDNAYWSTDEGNICYHQQFAATACPGPTLLGYLKGDILPDSIFTKYLEKFNLKPGLTLFQTVQAVYEDMLINGWKNFSYLFANNNTFILDARNDYAEVESISSGSLSLPITFKFRDKSITANYFESELTTMPEEPSQLNKTTEIYQMAEILWILGLELGLSKEACAGMIGNLQVESGLDPTSIEGIFDEKFISPKDSINKKHSLFDADNPNKGTIAMHNYMLNLFNNYENQGININRRAYLVDNEYYCAGLGLIQFTGPLAQRLFNFASAHNTYWYNLDVQLAAIVNLNRDRLQRFKIYMQDHKSVEQATRAWLGFIEAGLNHVYSWFGLGISSRIQYANTWYKTFSNLSQEQLTDLQKKYQSILNNFKSYCSQDINLSSITNDPTSISIEDLNKYDITIDLTELIDPYLIHTVIIDGQEIKIENNILKLTEAINAYINKKIQEYKNTQYLQIGDTQYSLLYNNSPILNITNDIIREDKKWHYQ